jgi:glucose/arabinose dehydrogenase
MSEEPPAAAEVEEEATTEATPTAATETAANDTATATTFDPSTSQLALEPIFDGLDQPLYITAAEDGSDRLFVLEKPGRIVVYGANRGEGEVFLDLTDRVLSTGYEQGLLGLAFAPNFAESGHFFVNYTDRNGDTVIARYEVSADDPNQGNPDSEFVVLSFEQPAANHNGGMILFGPDGYLWIGTGDGGRANDAFGHGQNPTTLLGAMLRIDVTSDPSQPYTIPADNPFVGDDSTLDEIWAIGLRNPWRYTFDRATGDLWIADVGQNQYEEVNLIPAGALGGPYNFGWPIMEGNQCFQANTCDQTGLTLPAFDYDHSQGCSVTGGTVYRGAAFPALTGIYFYADFCSGRLWGYWNDDQGERNELLIESGQAISSFGEDEAGEIYVTDLNSGVVSRLVIGK